MHWIWCRFTVASLHTVFTECKVGLILLMFRFFCLVYLSINPRLTYFPFARIDKINFKNICCLLWASKHRAQTQHSNAISVYRYPRIHSSGWCVNERDSKKSTHKIGRVSMLFLLFFPIRVSRYLLVPSMKAVCTFKSINFAKIYTGLNGAARCVDCSAPCCFFLWDCVFSIVFLFGALTRRSALLSPMYF